MKRKCKSVDVTARELAAQAVLLCLKPAKKRRRHDTIRLFASVLRVTREEARQALRDRDERYYKACETLADMLQFSIMTGNLKLERPKEVHRKDACSGKVRCVAVLGIWHLLLDHVAVLGLSDLFRSVGEYQVSSITGRGASYGDKAMRRWLAEAAGKKLYSVKLDVKNFYGSVDQARLCAWLEKRVANKKLMWLIRSLLSVVDEGMAIGSFLSQTLANIYLSALYHRAKEGYSRQRRGKRVATFRHALFYMDDMLLLGTSKRAMSQGVADLIGFAQEELGLTVKPTWCVREITARHPADLMGFRYGGGKVTLRRRIYKYARRMMLRASRHGRVSAAAARRIASYKGYIERTASNPKGINAASVYNMAARATSYNHDRKNNVYKSA